MPARERRVIVGVLAAWLGAASSAVAAQSGPPYLERITLGARTIQRAVGQGQHLTATGHYTGGLTRNLTQHVEYTSSDPNVVRVSNVKGDRSRLDAVGVGTATITATDPRTGVSSRASGDDVTVVVIGGLQSLSLAPQAINRWIGQSQQFTVTGHYGGGATRNLTQHVVFHSSDPSIAAVSSTPGDKSRVDAIAVGTATISAVDPATGISTSATHDDATVTVTLPGKSDNPPPVH